MVSATNQLVDTLGLEAFWSAAQTDISQKMSSAISSALSEYSPAGGGISVSTVEPTDTGLLWINPTTGIAKYYTGTIWSNVAAVWA